MATDHSSHSDTAANLAPLISKARDGDREALGRVLETAREYLRQFATQSLDSDLQAKLGRSDLIQETFVAAQEGFCDFRGTSHEELLAWLRRILANNLLNHYRNYCQTRKRSVARERPLVDGVPANEADTPSQISIRNEEQALLEKAMRGLQSDHQQVLGLRHRDGLSFGDVGRRMNRSADAARMLWYRAFEQLSCEIERLGNDERRRDSS